MSGCQDVSGKRSCRREDRKNRGKCITRMGASKYSLEICGKSCANTRLLSGSIDGHKNEVRFANALIDVGGEKQVFPPRLTDYVVQPGFINW